MSDEKPEKEFNSKTISEMSYSEIIAANRNSHKGTFMDRSWKKNINHDVYNDKDASFTNRLTSGSYTYHAIVDRIVKNFESRQAKVKFLEDLFARKSEFAESEREILLLKKTEIAVHRAFNSYRVPCLAMAMSFSVLAMVRGSTIASKLTPAMIIGPFTAMYNYHVGVYGVQRSVDDIMVDLMDA